MTLDPRAIGLQGLGFGALCVALQGFAQVSVSPPPPEPPPGFFGTPARIHYPIRPAQREEEEEILLLLAAVLQTLELS